MTLLVQTYNPAPDTDNHVDTELGLRLAKQQLQVPDARGRPRDGAVCLLLHPRSPDEPRFHRYMVGILALGRETAAGPEVIKGKGQIVLTGRRILGLVTDGTRGTETLSEATGKVAAFTLNRSDIASADFPTNWRGSPKQVVIGASSTNSRPLDIMLDIQVVILTIGNDGKTGRTTVQAFAEALDDEAAGALL